MAEEHCLERPKRCGRRATLCRRCLRKERHGACFILLMSGDLHRDADARSGHSSRLGKAGIAVFCLAVLLLGTQLGDDEPLRPPPEPRPVRTALTPHGASPEAPAELGTLQESEVVRTSGRIATPSDSVRVEGMRIEGDPSPPARDEVIPRAAGHESSDAGALLEQGAAAGSGESPTEADDPNAPSGDAGTLESDQPTESLPPPSLCGLLSCAAGYVCCNSSCGTCVPEGESCDQTACQARVQYPVSIVCGRSTCSNGQVCCNESCGTCASPGEGCDTTPCDNAIQHPVSIACGRSTCSNGQVCCNESCGTCTSPGEACDTAPCDNAIQYPVSIVCGRSTCSNGQVCCNPSCGTCVDPGQSCSSDLCD